MTTPAATYRVQVRPGFDLYATADIAGYLADLGVTHCYTAPLLAAVPGSAHGYDVADHTRVNPELGGEEGRRRLVGALREAGLGLVVDIVPNHAGIADPPSNPAWWDVLRLGRDSPYASWFDIDWTRGRLVVPVLADHGEPLDDLEFKDGDLHYFEHRFPVAPGTGEGTPREIHDRQHYELVDWRRGDTDLNYRRFFAITTLAGLRVEEPAVFDATHAEILRWYNDGELDGIRVDHPDGLRDPADYLRRLRRAAPDAWIVIEKILETGEKLPGWPIGGTTGYDAMREVCGLFIDTAAAPAFTGLDHHLTGKRISWAELTHATKYAAATRMLAAELNRLTRLAGEVAGAREGLAELAADFPVYRSYLPDGARHLAKARSEAGRRRPGMGRSLDALTARLRNPVDELAVRFQQFTGAVMAKGVEDTAYYRWTRFVALNEVGGDPERFGVRPSEFHAAAAARAPESMTSLSTHDTKRSEDVRARLAVLSEVPREWTAMATRWTEASGFGDPSLAHLLWQTAVGAWPIERERLKAYVEKAAREAGTSTSWTDPNADFERALANLVDRVYDDSELCREISEFAESITFSGWVNSLGQKVVQLAMPGIPDVYQGTELWDNSLVDPDNRRPVDFAARRAMLERIDGGELPGIDPSGAAKLLVTSRTLRARRDRPELFTGYTPLHVEGPAAAHAIAFDRGGACVVATRLPMGLARQGGWGETSLKLPDREYIDSFTGRDYSGSRLTLAEVLDTYPVALLIRRG
ncbi:malto-oligosyltrehalose synthase [Catenuloplanes indicus]|uniref:(1->4)-alpha-D-glucan 1-alpha-D-glucosylmutase n=1 Tax=Catenuloplanes indicus TaxID=137267 RepID=A0AAE3W750_9ACTN|nr:malto-oligosyltrehalose synthase [Catenuloplanes indicus]MDQ0369670.1 (1->4)-alpha-D-glucan 1-alpha-D-glucosylmutase [Catenuloplanes indicus]